MSDYLSALTSLDPTLPLSPYSSLSVSGLRAGFETIYDVPIGDIAADVVTATAQDLISRTVVDAIDSVTDVPILGTVLAVVSALVSGLAQSAAEREAREQAERRACLDRERARRAVGTGFAGAVVPSDVLAWYLDEWDPSRVVADGEGILPALGEALWIYGYGYPVNAWSPDDRRQRDARRDFDVLRQSAVTYGVTAHDLAGPTEIRRKQFRLAADAIALARNRREGDGGVTLWPVLLDLLLDQRARTSASYVRWLATHYVVRERGEKVRIASNLYEECTLPNARASVDRMRESWRLTIEPTYARDRERAEQIRQQVDAEVKRLLRIRFDPKKIRVVKSRSIVKPILVVGAGATALTLLAPNTAARAASALARALRWRP